MLTPGARQRLTTRRDRLKKRIRVLERRLKPQSDVRLMRAAEARLQRIKERLADMADLDPNDPKWAEQPPAITAAVLGSITASGATISGITFDTATDADSRLYVQTSTTQGEFDDADFDTDVDERYRLKDSGREFLPADFTDGSIVIDWLSAGTADVYVSMAVMIGGRLSDVYELGPFSTTGTTTREFNWNPGLYIGEATKIGKNFEPTYQEMLDFLTNVAWNRAAWTDNLLGCRIKLEWGEVEKGLNDYNWGVIDAYLDAMAPWNGRLLVTFTPMASNGNEHFAGPGDLASNTRFVDTINGGAVDCTGFDFVQWTRRTGKPRRLARLWDPATNVAQRYTAFFMAFMERYGNNPRVEAVGLHGESSLGTPENADSTFVGSNLGSTTNSTADTVITNAQLYDVTTFDGYLRQVGLDVLALGYPPWLQFPANGLGGNAGKELRNFLMWRKFADDNAGIGFRKPDCHTQDRPDPHLPKTDRDRHFIGWPQYSLNEFGTEEDLHGRWPEATDWQNPDENRYTVNAAGLLNHWQGAFGWDGTSPGEVWAPTSVSPDLCAPPIADTGSGLATFNPVHGGTHPVVIFSQGATEDLWLPVFQTNGWVPAFTAMPQAWTDLGGVSVRTGVL